MGWWRMEMRRKRKRCRVVSEADMVLKVTDGDFLSSKSWTM